MGKVGRGHEMKMNSRREKGEGILGFCLVRGVQQVTFRSAHGGHHDVKEGAMMLRKALRLRRGANGQTRSHLQLLSMESRSKIPLAFFSRRRRQQVFIGIFLSETRGATATARPLGRSNYLLERSERAPHSQVRSILGEPKARLYH